MFEKSNILYAVSLIGGFLLGIALMQLSAGAAQDNARYCQSVEDAIQSNMSQGFVNCLEAGSVQVNISEKVERQSELRCVCRKKTDEGLQILKITTAGSQ